MPPEEAAPVQEAQESEAAEAPRVEAPTSPSPAFDGDPIFEALSQHKPEEPAEAGEGEAKPGDEKTEAEKPEVKDGEKPDARAKRKAAEKEIFSDKALATPDGVQKARSYVQQRQSKLDGMGQRLAEERQQFKSERETFLGAMRQAEAELAPQRAVAQKLVGALQRLNNPESIEDFLGALGEIAGKPGIEIWEQGSRFMVAGGKRPAPSREVEELKGTVEGLRRELAEREERREQARIDEESAHAKAFIERRSEEIVQTAKDATKYPELAKSARLGLGENIVAEVAGMKRAAKAKGQRLGDSEALAIIEGELQKLTATGARAPASPAEASSAAARVTSIAPSMTRSAGASREKTEAELADDLARDPAALGTILGIPL
jgi:hypothetical protein